MISQAQQYLSSMPIEETQWQINSKENISESGGRIKIDFISDSKSDSSASGF